jgi:hypothetical protein
VNFSSDAWNPTAGATTHTKMNNRKSQKKMDGETNYFLGEI